MSAVVDETMSPHEEANPGRPVLKIRNLHIRNLRSIRQLDLPDDGLGWGVEIPETIVVGGVNGSGKSTLLEFIYAILQLLVERPDSPPNPPSDRLMAREAQVDFQFEVPGALSTIIRFLIGPESFVDERMAGNCIGYRHSRGLYRTVFKGFEVHNLHSWLVVDETFDRTIIPGVVHFPSERRTLELLPEQFKSPGLMPAKQTFAFRWVQPRLWKDSFEARLYHARWLDLNAQTEGGETAPRTFDSYALAFERFFGGSKKLRWVKGELLVEVQNGSLHGLAELSSGEKQIITLMGELLTRWRPGSLILIDEPELHLHSSWQYILLQALTEWRRERGGQLILATQSNQMFSASEPGTQVLLGGEHLG